MPLRSRISAVRRCVSATRLVVLLAFSVLITWLFVYLRMVEYLTENGIDPDKVGHGNIAMQVFDPVTAFFGLLVFLVAGVIPLAILLVNATPSRSNAAQILWAAMIVVLVVLARATS